MYVIYVYIHICIYECMCVYEMFTCTMSNITSNAFRPASRRSAAGGGPTGQARAMHIYIHISIYVHMYIYL